MHTKIETFVQQAQELWLESGPLLNRSSFGQLKQLATEFAPFETLIGMLPTAHLLLLGLLQTEEGSASRDQTLTEIFSLALREAPDGNFLEAIKLVPSLETEKNLLPFIYAQGNQGSVSCYLAAKLNLKLAPEAFQYFLRARIWSKTDLFNLAFLARRNEIAGICANLESLTKSEISAATKENFDEFRYLLFNEHAKEPLLPDIIAQKTVERKPNLPEIAVAQQSVANQVQETPLKTTATAAPGKRRLYGAPTPQNPPLSGKNQLKKGFQSKILGIAFFLLLIIFFWSLNRYTEEEKPIEKSLAQATIPDYWVDALTQKQITPKFLAADKDYRMGELFLTRDQFTEALSLFQDALSIDPNHIQANFRIGYCRMQSGDANGAIKAFQATLKKDPGFKIANLYLARIAVSEKDDKAAEKYFNAEMALNKDPSITMEFANYLNKNGKEDQANALIADLEKQYPDRMFILSPLAKPVSEKEAAK